MANQDEMKYPNEPKRTVSKTKLPAQQEWPSRDWLSFAFDC